MHILRHSGSSSSVIDLTFANSKIENAITNWAIDENAVTGSDHEVIRFELIASFNNLTSHAPALANKYNCNKADWNKFAKFLDENSINYELKVQSLLNNHQFEESAIHLQKIVTGSDYEVIRFELIASFKNLTSHATALSNKYNCNKADSNKFAKFLDENSINYESKVQSLFNNHQFDESAIHL